MGNTWGTWPDYTCPNCGAADALTETEAGTWYCTVCSEYADA